MTDLDRTLELYERIRPRITRAITNSATFLDGYPTGGTASGDNEGGRTAILATAHIEHGDSHGQLRRDLERCIDRLADLVDQLAPSNRAADHLRTHASDECPTGCCQSCWRDHGHREPARTEGSRLCKWCAEWANELGTDMPYMTLLRLRHQGKRITQRDVDQAVRNKL